MQISACEQRWYRNFVLFVGLGLFDWTSLAAGFSGSARASLHGDYIVTREKGVGDMAPCIIIENREQVCTFSFEDV